MNGSFEPLQVVIPEIGEFEQPSKQEPSAWSDQYLAGLGQGLQARRQVWRIADKRELTSGTALPSGRRRPPGRWQCRSVPQASLRLG